MQIIALKHFRQLRKTSDRSRPPRRSFSIASGLQGRSEISRSTGRGTSGEMCLPGCISGHSTSPSPFRLRVSRQICALFILYHSSLNEFLNRKCYLAQIHIEQSGSQLRFLSRTYLSLDRIWKEVLPEDPLSLSRLSLRTRHPLILSPMFSDQLFKFLLPFSSPRSPKSLPGL